MMITTEYTAASTRRALVPARGPSAWPELDASVVGTSLSRSDLAHQACAVKTATRLRRFGEGIQNRRGGRMLGIFFLRTVYIFFLFYTVTFAMKLGNEKPACSDARRARAISALQTWCWELWFYGVEWSCPASPALSRPVFPASWTATASGGSWLEPGPRAPSLAAHGAASYQGAWSLSSFPCSCPLQLLCGPLRCCHFPCWPLWGPFLTSQMPHPASSIVLPLPIHTPKKTPDLSVSDFVPPFIEKGVPSSPLPRSHLF